MSIDQKKQQISSVPVYQIAQQSSQPFAKSILPVLQDNVQIKRSIQRSPLIKWQTDTKKRSVQSTGDISGEIKQTVNLLMLEHRDNELFKQSLDLIEQSKLFFDQLDLLLQELGQNIFYSLDLEEYLQISGYLASLNSSQQSLKLFLVKSPQQNYSPYTKHSEYQPVDNSSLLILQEASTQNSFDEVEENFLAKLFRLSTLYYLAGFWVAFSFLKWLVKLFFSPKF